MPLIYGSVCSGIEAASVAWHPMGWRAAFLSEIEPFPRAVLSHHYPSVPLHGDFTTIKAAHYEPIELLVGGTPCQSFSIAGLRSGLSDERGNLALEYLRLANRLRPRWLVWENVPGVLSSNGGRDFGAILGGLVELGYGFAYRVLDAQHFGVPQRRRRVFVVGYLGDWRPAAAVLFERHSLQGHSAPRREAGEGSSVPVIKGAAIGRQPHNGPQFGDSLNDGSCYTLNCTEVHAICHGPTVSPTLKARDYKGPSSDGDGDGDGAPLIAHTFRAQAQASHRADTETFVTHALTANGFNARQSDVIQYGDMTGPLDTHGHTIALAFSCKDHGADAGDISPTLRAMGFAGSHANAGGQVAVAFAQNSRSEVRMVGGDGAVVGALAADVGAQQQTYIQQRGVRRLTPRECERLQGFPDGWTDVPYRGKPAADGPRYKALGNSMAVPCMAWIGLRIESFGKNWEKQWPLTSSKNGDDG